MRSVLPGDGMLRGVLRVALSDKQHPVPPGRRGDWHQLRSVAQLTKSGAADRRENSHYV